VSPKFFHFIAKDAFSRSDQFRGIDQVRNTTRMHVNRGAQLSESPRCAGMIKMDVTQKRVAHVGGLEAEFSQLSNNSLEGGFRPNIKENKAAIGFQCGDREDICPAEMAGIQNVNFQSTMFQNRWRYCKRRSRSSFGVALVAARQRNRSG
jgi:hypothetical protein